MGQLGVFQQAIKYTHMNDGRILDAKTLTKIADSENRRL